MRTAAVTIVRGRHEHLRRQLNGVAGARFGPDEHVIVALGDPAIRNLTAGSPRTRVLELDVADVAELALAAARNAGARAAIAAGAELIVFLDVDCIPAPALFTSYAAAAADPRHRDALLCGPVAYLPAPGNDGYDLSSLAELAQPHAARPNPAPGTVEVARDRRLFWSLSFAVTTPTWNRIGGFCPDYVGYGGEDTDFAEQAHAAGVGMRWVGGATAFHQHHPVSAPPVEHLVAIVRNAHVFFGRWGWWPMTGWLTAFAERGLAEFDPARGWVVIEPAGARR